MSEFLTAVWNAAVECNAEVRHLFGEDVRDFNQWDRDFNTKAVRYTLMDFEVLDIQLRERGT